MLVTTYLVNLLCAVVECKGRMQPPEAYIAEYTPGPPERRSLDTFNVSNNRYVTIDTNKFVEDEYNSRMKRLFPQNNQQNGNNNQNRLSSSDQNRGGLNTLRSSMQSFADAIPNFFESVSRVVHSGNNLDSINHQRSFNTEQRMGRRLNEVNRNAYGDPLPVVFLKNGGGVEGYYMGTLNGRKLAAYEGIPFAEPPVGNLRFKPPIPARPWKGIMKAQKPGSSCLQTHPIYIFRVTGDEDCLTVNVYSPQIPYRKSNKLYPVLIYIHGGSFMYGSGSEYGPAYLLDNDVVLVTFNYRLGALGFLSTGDSTVSSNNGLKDQALLIKWVHDNIIKFGGDPDRVTLSGQSAGAVSAHLHLIANKVTKYFHAGISMSGSGFGFWPVLTKDRARRLTNSLARRLGCSSRSSVELIRCLQGISGSWIIMIQLKLFDWIPFHPLVLFAPVVEPYDEPGAYLTRWPEDAYANMDVARKPWIFGETISEGHFETYMIKLFMQTYNIASNFRRYLPIVLDYDYYTREPRTTQITEAIMQFYGGNNRRNGLDMDTLSAMYTDRFYSNTIHKAIHAHSRIAPTMTYAYIFDHVGKYNLGELFGVPQDEWGSGHTEDSMMVFNSSVFHHGLSKRDDEYQLSKIMTNVIGNFVASGTPDYWERSTNEVLEIWDTAVNFRFNREPRIRYLRFGTNITMISDPFYERVKFWESLRIPT